jgi:hypothetical protein
VKRTDVIRFHNEEAAAYSTAAERATDPASTHLQEQAVEHQAYADMARHYEYPEDLED